VDSEIDLLIEPPKRSFRRAYKHSASSEIIIPVVRPLVVQAAENFGELTVELPKNRPYDGWFHPSTHPTWDERQLYLYLTEPESLEEDALDEAAHYSAIHGTFWHTFLQTVMLFEGMIVVSNPEATKPHDRAELPVRDLKHNTRGHLDGVLNHEFFPSLEVPQGLEIKTLNGFRANDVPEGFPASPERIAWLREDKPRYYWQAQEYMRMSGLRMQYFLFMGMDYPFPMAEVWLPYDEAEALSVTRKYSRVLGYVADQEMPDPCCSVKSTKAKQCPVRTGCEVGRLTCGAA
jgi:hypothetical protein